MALGTLDATSLTALRGRGSTLAHERTLPVVDALVPCIPDGALVRGQVVVTCGVAELSSALAVTAGATHAGSWLAVVERAGVFEVGADAAAELGVVLQRTVLVTLADVHAAPWSEVLAALVEGFDVVIVPVDLPLGAAVTRRLQARLRTRGGVVVVVGGRGDWQPDLVLRSTPLGAQGGWEPLDQHGRLRGRGVVVDVDARRRGAPGRHTMWLPTDTGTVAAMQSADGASTAVGRPSVARAV